MHLKLNSVSPVSELLFIKYKVESMTVISVFACVACMT